MTDKVFRIFLIATFISVSFITGVLVGNRKGIPFVGVRDTNWAIGIYGGDSPFDLSPGNVNNPVMTSDDVIDRKAIFVADPFLIHEENTWYLFFEVMDFDTDQGDIGLATSNDGLSWAYKRIVIDEPFHLSYPYVFKWNNEYFMIPETTYVNELRLYKATNFPSEWTFVKTLLKGHYADPSIFYYNNKWWIFAETSGPPFDTLCLYYADKLIGPWQGHPLNPIVKGNANIARPGGRVIKYDNHIIRFTQDCEPIYGNQVRAFRITELTVSSYKEEEVEKSPILKPSGTGWNARLMHQIDAHNMGDNKWIACVDGCGKRLAFGLEY